jgi:hypothetical protein
MKRFLSPTLLMTHLSKIRITDQFVSSVAEEISILHSWKRMSAGYDEILKWLMIRLEN